MHDRFWAEDLIYTRSAGIRIGKADVLRDARSAPAPKPGDPTTTYSAEDIRIQQYGDTAIVAFRLVANTVKGNSTFTARFLNSGTFLKRNGRWQVVNWQATRMALNPEETKQAVAAAEAMLHTAMRQSDVGKLDALLDETFMWTQRDGKQVTRKQLLDQLSSGSLKYSSLETSNTVVTVYGDAGVVRGETLRQRSAIPDTPGSGDAAPFKAFYTLIFINRGGEWKAVAMHSSRPGS
jgi:hypothetical protein